MSALAGQIVTVGIAAVTAVVILVVGRRRGLQEVEDESDEVTSALVRDLKARVALLETERAEDRVKIATLERKVADLENERSVLDAALQRWGRPA